MSQYTPRPPEPPWHPGYCVARTDEKSIICYHDEQVAEPIGKHLRRIRLDDGFASFCKHWQGDVMSNSTRRSEFKTNPREVSSRIGIRSYPTYSQSSLGKLTMECFRTDSLPTLNGKQPFSTFRPFKRRNLG
ncbi:unnamed protein product [Thelazia callipaeda]|uniref:Integrase catalytic domain-containing protein n=1 Tax=Thelazia callipaeda TaxID=103827 RepID=A0A0N5CX25_THECL|nr:unnamed protein product [Thelazia callipaeda]